MGRGEAEDRFGWRSGGCLVGGCSAIVDAERADLWRPLTTLKSRKSFEIIRVGYATLVTSVSNAGAPQMMHLGTRQ